MTAKVEARARAEFDVEIRNSTAAMTAAEMERALSDFDVVMPTLGDIYDAGVFSRVPEPLCRL